MGAWFRWIKYIYEWCKDRIQLTPYGIGTVFYVDPVNGSNGNSGLTQAKAFATTQYAVDQCVANRGDTIVRMPGNEYSDEGGVAAGVAIAMNKRGITLIGSHIYNPDMAEGLYSYGRYDSTLGWGGGGALGPVFIVTQPCNMIGLNVVVDHAFQVGVLGVPDVMPLGCAICCDGYAGGFSGSYNYIAKCRFPNWGGAVGVWMSSSYNLIEDCIFEALSSVGVRVDELTHPSTFNKIKGCHFRGALPDGIELINGTHDSYIEDCEFDDQITGSGISGSNLGRGHSFRNTFALSEAAGAGGAYDQNLVARELGNFFCAGNHYIDEPAATQGACDPTS